MGEIIAWAVLVLIIALVIYPMVRSELLKREREREFGRHDASTAGIMSMGLDKDIGGTDGGAGGDGGAGS